jgi:hypothetical protein
MILFMDMWSIKNKRKLGGRGRLNMREKIAKIVKIAKIAKIVKIAKISK